MKKKITMQKIRSKNMLEYNDKKRFIDKLNYLSSKYKQIPECRRDPILDSLSDCSIGYEEFNRTTSSDSVFNKKIYQIVGKR